MSDQSQPQADQPPSPDPESGEGERTDDAQALLRLRAEFANYKARTTRTTQEAISAAGDRQVTALLPALDAFFAAEHTLSTSQLTDAARGLLAAATLLESVLTAEGLTRIGSIGEPFDVEIHDAVEHIDTDSTELVIQDVLRPGWCWRGRTLRPAMVKVAG
jgi:molecular chaperone GrpE